MTNFFTLIKGFLILIIVLSCSTLKNKQKQKNKTQSESKTNISKMEDSSILETAVIATKDSASSTIGISQAKKLTDLSQNFTLKNNGKCENGGELRFVSFSDKNGNKTEIPVNDNTELNFTNKDAVLEENTELKVEISRLKESNSILQNELKYSQNLQIQEQQKTKSTDISIQTEKKSTNFTAFLLVALCSVLLWELGKKLITIKL